MNGKEPEVTRCMEVKTGSGQIITVYCQSDDKVVSEMEQLLNKIWRIELPVTREVLIPHGGYGGYSRFEIEQHEYAGGHDGFVEILEIKNPPDGRCGNVFYEYASNGESVFHEFESLDDALAAWSNFFAHGKMDATRSVSCGWFTPWFYAVANQALWNDFAFPSEVVDDPIYRPLRKFVVSDDYRKNKVVKVCMGMRRRTHGSYPGDEEKEYRVILWSDGTESDEYSFSFSRIKPLEENKQWIREAYEGVRDIFNGELKKMSVQLDDRVITVSVRKQGVPLDLTGKRIDGRKFVIEKEIKEGGKEIITGDENSSESEKIEV